MMARSTTGTSNVSNSDDDLGNLQQPQGFGGHRTDLSRLIMLLHTCAAEGFF